MSLSGTHISTQPKRIMYRRVPNAIKNMHRSHPYLEIGCDAIYYTHSTCRPSRGMRGRSVLQPILLRPIFPNDIPVITASRNASGCAGCVVSRGRNSHAAQSAPRLLCGACEEPNLTVPREGRLSGPTTRRHPYFIRSGCPQFLPCNDSNIPTIRNVPIAHRGVSRITPEESLHFFEDRCSPV